MLGSRFEVETASCRPAPVQVTDFSKPEPPTSIAEAYLALPSLSLNNQGSGFKVLGSGLRYIMI